MCEVCTLMQKEPRQWGSAAWVSNVISVDAMNACTHCTLPSEKVCRLSLGRRTARGVFAHLHTLHTFFHFTRALVGWGMEWSTLGPMDGSMSYMFLFSLFFLSLSLFYFEKSMKSMQSMQICL